MGNIIVSYLVLFFEYLAYMLTFGEPTTIVSLIIFGVSIWTANHLCPPKPKNEYGMLWPKRIATIILYVSVIICGWSLFKAIQQDTKENNSTVNTSSKYTTSSSSYESVTDTGSITYYKENYPMTWGYIDKNYAYPDFYVGYYDRVWGKLQKFHGDGIKFDTLNSYEQTLVEYPKIQSRIYFANEKTKEYHSTSMCYTLLKNQESIVSRNCDSIKDYDPCSKCVGDTQHINKVRSMYGYD